MRILHVNDVSSVGSLLVRASSGRDALYQPVLRRQLSGSGRLVRFVAGRARDAWRIRRLFAGQGFSHLHIHYASFATLAPGLPYTLHVHGGDLLQDLSGGAKERAIRWGVRRARAVIVSTPNLLGPISALRGGAVYLPNPMEVPEADASPPTGEGPRVLVLSKMDPRKGWPGQIRIVSQLLARFPAARVRFVAGGHLPVATRQDMVAALKALGAEPLGVMPRSAFLEEVAGTDFAIGQLELGALGMSEMEALAAGIPTVANAREHEALGYHPPVIAPEGAVDRLASLWRNPEERAELARRSRTYIAKVHDPETCLRRLESVLVTETQPT